MTINIDLTNPVNAIRAMVGDVDCSNPIMSDNMYQQIFDMNNINDRDECVVIWFSSIQAVGYLLAQFAPEGQRYRERVNAVEVEQYGQERYKTYERLLSWLRGNPPMNCDLTGTLFQFGGTYTECDKIYTLRYMKSCLCSIWPRAWIDGYTLSWEDGAEIYI